MNPPDLSAARWRKGSRSSGQGGACVEVADLTQDLSAARWRKSSRSTAQGGDCVEVADLTPVIAVRDSKDPDGPKLTLNTSDWHELARQIKNGHHDLA